VESFLLKGQTMAPEWGLAALGQKTVEEQPVEMVVQKNEPPTTW